MDSSRIRGIMDSKAMGSMRRLTSLSAQRMKSVWGPVRKVLAFSPASDAVAPASCLCIGIEKGYVTAVHASRLFSRYGVKGFKRYHFNEEHYPSPEEAASAAALAARDMNAGKTDVVLSIPKQWVVLRNAELPAAVSGNLTEVVSYEMDRLTPFRAEDAYYDYVHRNGGAKISLFIAAAKADKINVYLSALHEVGLAVRDISFDISGASTLCRYLSGESSFVFMEVTEKGARGGAVVGGLPARAASLDFTHDDDKYKAEAVEAKIALLASSLPRQSSATRVLLSFSGKTSAIREMIKQKGGYSLAVIDEMDKKIEGLTDFREVSPAVAGAALDYLWPKAGGLNLLRKGACEKERTPFVLTILLALIIVGIVGAYLIMPISIENQRLQGIEKQIAARKGEVRKVEDLKKEVEALKAEIAFVDNFKNSRPMAINMLKELTTILPSNIWLTRVRIAESQVNIEGYAPSANVLIPKLESSRYFRRVEFASPTFKDARQNMDRFQIKMEIKENKDEKK